MCQLWLYVLGFQDDIVKEIYCLVGRGIKLKFLASYKYENCQ